MNISIIIPAKNEESSISDLIGSIKTIYPQAEIIVIDDGSEDNTAEYAKQAGAQVIHHPYSMGNGAAIKTGARNASGDILVFLDADGQHKPADISRLLRRLEEGYDMVVGARAHSSQANAGRSIANGFYNRLASYMTGHRIQDLTSGFRAVRATKFREFLYLLPNGFSYPTTITMAFFRAGYLVDYIAIVTSKREGKSHIHPLKDGIRFLLIIFKIGTLYSPLKLFVPISLVHFFVGLGYYAFTFLTQHRLSSMTVFLLTAGVTIFLIGLVSEQITQLMYRNQTTQAIERQK